MQPTAACCFLYFFFNQQYYSQLVASPSVTCVRQEESNHWILALRAACLEKKSLMLSNFFFSFAFFGNNKRSEMWKICWNEKNHWMPNCRAMCSEKWNLFCSKEARFKNLGLYTEFETFPQKFCVCFRDYIMPNATLLLARLNLPVLTLRSWIRWKYLFENFKLCTAARSSRFQLNPFMLPTQIKNVFIWSFP